MVDKMDAEFIELLENNLLRGRERNLEYVSILKDYILYKNYLLKKFDMTNYELNKADVETSLQSSINKADVETSLQSSIISGNQNYGVWYGFDNNVTSSSLIHDNDNYVKPPISTNDKNGTCHLNRKVMIYSQLELTAIG